MPAGRPCQRIYPVPGEVWSNELGPRYLEHRRVLVRAGETVRYLVVHGAKEGDTGEADAREFMRWARAKISA